MSETRQRAAVSIVCVSNNPRVLNDCLVRSVDIHRPTAPKTELIVVENSQGEFSSAGAALNYGASLAHNEVCVFVHQDVYLHSLVRIEEAASALLTDSGTGLVGALGTVANRDLRGRIRDRFALIGCPTDGFADVDSLDEVLFMVRRRQLQELPLSEDPAIAWHAYAVEYGARVRRDGRRVVAARIPLTHNSLTINVDRLGEAHVHVGELYPEQVPIATTCGIIDGAPANRTKLLARHRWRYRWLKGSRHAFSAQRAVGLPVVLSDIRLDADNLMDSAGEGRLRVVSLASQIDGDVDLAETIELGRRGRKFEFRVASSETLADLISSRPQTDSILLTNLTRESLSNLRIQLCEADALIGFFDAIGFWSIIGPTAKASLEAWRIPSAKPIGLPGARAFRA